MRTDVENEENVEQIIASELTSIIIAGVRLTATISIILLIAIVGLISLLC